MLNPVEDPVPDFVPPEHLQAIHHAILRHFVETGQAPTIADLQKALTQPLPEVEAMVAELAKTCLYRDPTSGEILAAYPFSARPTPHYLHLPNGQEVYAMCAMDALGASAMLNQPVSIHSRCAQCGAPISLDVEGETLITMQPATAVVWYQAGTDDCVPAISKCPGINFFCQASHRTAWGEAHPDSNGYELTVAKALERGNRTFGHLLQEGLECV
jgi:hypothetical protein